eukprot:7848385-Pyramimonas_sp.AAC.1
MDLTGLSMRNSLGHLVTTAPARDFLTTHLVAAIPPETSLSRMPPSGCYAWHYSVCDTRARENRV